MKPIGVVGSGPLAKGIVVELVQRGSVPTEFSKPPAPSEIEQLSCLVLAEDDDALNLTYPLDL